MVLSDSEPDAKGFLAWLKTKVDFDSKLTKGEFMRLLLLLLLIGLLIWWMITYQYVSVDCNTCRILEQENALMNWDFSKAGGK